jgi:hypothetical protein
VVSFTPRPPCPRAGLDDMERRIIFPYRDSNSYPTAIQPVASRYTDCAITELKII